LVILTSEEEMQQETDPKKDSKGRIDCKKKSRLKIQTGFKIYA
jgi:hypothetical protein